MCVCHMNICIYIYIYIYRGLYVCVYAYTYIYISVCVCVCVYIYISKAVMTIMTVQKPQAAVSNCGSQSSKVEDGSSPAAGLGYP